MNTKSQTRRQRTLNILSLVIGVVLIVVIGFYGQLKKASSAVGTPEKYITDVNGVKKATFNLNEKGILTLRAFAEGSQASQAKTDVILAVDTSSEMSNRINPSSNTTKIADAKTALDAFIDHVDTTAKMQVGVVTFHGISATHIGVAETPATLTAVDSAAAKTNLKGVIDSISAEPAATGASGIGEGVKNSNDELSSVRAQAGGQKAIILLSSQSENATPYLNAGSGPFETVSNLADASLAVSPDSELARAIAVQTSIIALHYGNEATFIGSTSGGALLRYTASRSNSLPLPAGFNWSGDYRAMNSEGVQNGIDGNYFYNLNSAADLKDALTNISSKIDVAGGATLDVSERLSGEVQFDRVLSVSDKGGQIRNVAATNISPNYYKFQLTGVPGSYFCQDDDTTCKKAGAEVSFGENKGKFLVSSNFVDIKLSLIFMTPGNFDLDSNFTGCRGGSLSKVSRDSRVDYIDPKTSAIYQSFDFPYLCLTVSQGAPKIIKSTYKVIRNGNDVSYDRAASFEAGDEVRVVLEINEPDDFRQDYKIEDTLPAFVKSAVKYKFTDSGGGVKDNLSPQVSANKINFTGSKDTELTRGLNTIEYIFRL